MWHFQRSVIAQILLNGKCISSSNGFKTKQERPRQMKKTGGTAAEALLQLDFQMSLSASFLPREFGRKIEI